MVYAADHPALALLEVRVHLDLPPGLLPADYVMMRLALPDPAETLDAMPEDPRVAGDAWLAGAGGAVLRVPSVLVPAAANLLLNPAHPGAATARIDAIAPFAFDPRLWLGAGGP
jgi:RES domain-containing protein